MDWFEIGIGAYYVALIAWALDSVRRLKHRVEDLEERTLRLDVARRDAELLAMHVRILQRRLEQLESRPVDAAPRPARRISV